MVFTIAMKWVDHALIESCQDACLHWCRFLALNIPSSVVSIDTSNVIPPRGALPAAVELQGHNSVALGYSIAYTWQC